VTALSAETAPVSEAPMTSDAWARIVSIGLMCMAQTFPYVLVTATIPTIFRAEGLDLRSFAAFSLLTIPQWIKFLWAPLVDGRGSAKFGMRKSWILPCTVGVSLSALLLVFFPPAPDNLPIVLGMMFALMIIMATQDTAVDAYTLENLHARERGVGSGVKVLFEAIGEAVALGGLMFIYVKVSIGGMSGWPLTLLAASILLLLLTMPVIIRREPPLDPRILRRRAAGDGPNLMKFIKRKDTPYICGLLLIGGFFNMMLTPLAGPMLVDANYSLVEVGLTLGLVMPLAMPLGAMTGGVLISRFGLRRMLRYLCFASPLTFVPIIALVHYGVPTGGVFGELAAAISSMAPDWPGGPRVVLAALALVPPFVLIPQFHMLYTVLRMEWASLSQAGTDFTSHGALYNIGRTATTAVCPLIAATLGWSAFLMCIALCGLVVAVINVTLHDRVFGLTTARKRAELDGLAD
jgi:MFS family permease